MTVGEASTTPTPSASEVDQAAAARWHAASMRAAEVEAMPRRPVWTRVAVGVGTASMVGGIAFRLLRVFAPDVAALPWIVGPGTVLLIVLGGALFLLMPWSAWRQQGSVLASLTRAERRTVRREVDGRVPLDPAHLPVLSGYARQRRLMFVATVTFAGFWSLLASTWRIGPVLDGWTLFSTAYLLLLVAFPLWTGIIVLRQRPIPPRWG